MPPIYLFLIISVTVPPICIVLHAISLVLPLYLILLGVGVVSIGLSLRPSRWFMSEEVISLVSLMTGVICSVVGFALSPAVVQLTAAIALAILYKRYWANVKIG